MMNGVGICKGVAFMTFNGYLLPYGYLIGIVYTGPMAA